MTMPHETPPQSGPQGLSRQPLPSLSGAGLQDRAERRSWLRSRRTRRALSALPATYLPALPALQAPRVTTNDASTLAPGMWIITTTTTCLRSAGERGEEPA